MKKPLPCLLRGFVQFNQSPLKLFSKLIILFIVITLNTNFCFSQAIDTLDTEEKFKNSGFIDFNGYYDTRDFSVLTINLFAKLPHRFQYFSLTNYSNNQDSPDLENFYAEHNLRWAINKKLPIDLTYQYVLRQGEKNDDHRFGLRWRLHNTSFLKTFFSEINMAYTFNPMFLQLRSKTEVEYMTIIEHAYKINIFPEKFNNRVYIAGFADQNFKYSDTNKLSFNWVSEHQIGVRIISELYAIAEYRINTFLPKENYGLGYGLEYKIVF